MSPRVTRASSGNGSAKGLLEKMEKVSEKKTMKKLKHADRRKARLQKSKALAMGMRRDMRLNSPSGSDPVDLEDLEEGLSQASNASEILEEEEDSLKSHPLQFSSDESEGQGKSQRRVSPRHLKQQTKSGSKHTGKINKRRASHSKSSRVQAAQIERWSSPEAARALDILSDETSIPQEEDLKKWESDQENLDLSLGLAEDLQFSDMPELKSSLLLGPESDAEEDIYQNMDLDYSSDDEESEDDNQIEKLEESAIIRDVLLSGELDNITADDLLPPPEGYELMDIGGWQVDDFLNLDNCAPSVSAEEETMVESPTFNLGGFRPREVRVQPRRTSFGEDLVASLNAAQTSQNQTFVENELVGTESLLNAENLAALDRFIGNAFVEDSAHEIYRKNISAEFAAKELDARSESSDATVVPKAPENDTNRYYASPTSPVTVPGGHVLSLSETRKRKAEEARLVLERVEGNLENRIRTRPAVPTLKEDSENNVRSSSIATELDRLYKLRKERKAAIESIRQASARHLEHREKLLKVNHKIFEPEVLQKCLKESGLEEGDLVRDFFVYKWEVPNTQQVKDIADSSFTELDILSLEEQIDHVVAQYDMKDHLSFSKSKAPTYVPYIISGLDDSILGTNSLAGKLNDQQRRKRFWLKALAILRDDIDEEYLVNGELQAAEYLIEKSHGILDEIFSNHESEPSREDILQYIKATHASLLTCSGSPQQEEQLPTPLMDSQMTNAVNVLDVAVVDPIIPLDPIVLLN